jgi:hypothetical protein
MKRIILFEEFNFNLEIKDSKIIRQAVEDGYFRIAIGSGDLAINASGKSESQFVSDVEEEIKELFDQNLFDWEFYYNWLDSEGKKEYRSYFKTVILPTMMADIDSFFDKYMKYEYSPSSTLRKLWRYKGGYSVKDTIMKSDKLSEEVKEAYRKYRQEYAGESMNESEKTPDDLTRIYGSEFFNWNSKDRLSTEKMIAILDWYDSLPEDKKEFVDILRQEAKSSDDAW